MTGRLVDVGQIIITVDLGRRPHPSRKLVVCARAFERNAALALSVLSTHAFTFFFFFLFLFILLPPDTSTRS
jgi:hypothetical protein